MLDLCLLSLLATGPDYGYGLARRLEGAGLGELPGGTMYPALLRLEQRGLIEVSAGPCGPGPRWRHYCLTATGRRSLSVLRTGRCGFRDRMDRVVLAAPERLPAVPGDPGPGREGAGRLARGPPDRSRRPGAPMSSGAPEHRSGPG